MAESITTTPKAQRLSVSVYPIHNEIIEMIRRRRAINGERIPKVSAVVQEALEHLIQREIESEVS